MSVWGQIIDTLAVVIVWPLAVVVIAWIFRRPLRELINRIRKFEGMGAKFEIAEDVANAARSGFREQVRRDGDVDSVVDVEVEEPAAIEPAPEAVATEPQDSEHGEPTYTRGEVEKFIKAASEAGYEMGFARVFENDPEPVIKWSEDNFPEIDHWKANAGVAYLPAPAPLVDYDEKVRRLEKEIRELTKENNTPKLTFLGRNDGTEATLNELKAHLRGLDPNSPWAD